jgi:hypothetical protein
VWFSDWSTKLSWNEQGFVELLTGLSVGGVKYATLFFTDSTVKVYIKHVLVKSNLKSDHVIFCVIKPLIMTTANNAAKFNNSENKRPRVYIFLSASCLF